MIYLVNRGQGDAVRAYLESPRAQDLSGRIRIVPYQDAVRLRRLPAGTYVFSDHERFSSVQRELAKRLWERLAREGGRVRLLNDPTRVLTRGPLLRRLSDVGRNSFRAVVATESLEALRYPLFVREIREHTGSLTGLIHDREQMRSTLRRLTSPMKKYRARDLLVVEFCDTSGGSGLFRKYSAFRVGDRILPRYLSVSDHWVVKTGGELRCDEQAIAEERAYMEQNPHEEWIREVFHVARIEYGRMDYGMLGDTPQVWEINTNPIVGPMPRRLKRNPTDPRVKAMREPARLLFHEPFRAAVRAIDMAEAAEPDIEFLIEPALRRRLRAERVARALTSFKVRALRKLRRR